MNRFVSMPGNDILDIRDRNTPTKLYENPSKCLKENTQESK